VSLLSMRVVGACSCVFDAYSMRVDVNACLPRVDAC